MRPLKLPFAATRVIKASTVLTPAMKLVWLEDYALDQGDEAGCYMSAGSVASRLGMDAETVEKYRRAFLRAGLHRVERKNGRRGASWYCTLPPDYQVGARPTPDQVERKRALLDDYLRALRKPDGGPGNNPDAGAGQSPSITRTVGRVTSGEGGKGGALQPSPVVVDNLQPQKELEDRSEVSHETNTEVGGASDTDERTRRQFAERLDRIRAEARRRAVGSG